MSEHTIRRRVDDRTLRAYRTGPRLIRIDRDSLINFTRSRSAMSHIEADNKHQGLVLVKSGRRDPRELDYDGHWLVDVRSGDLVAGGEFGVSLNEVAQELLGDRP